MKSSKNIEWDKIQNIEWDKIQNIEWDNIMPLDLNIQIQAHKEQQGITEANAILSNDSITGVIESNVSTEITEANAILYTILSNDSITSVIESNVSREISEANAILSNDSITGVIKSNVSEEIENYKLHGTTFEFMHKKYFSTHRDLNVGGYSQQFPHEPLSQYSTNRGKKTQQHTKFSRSYGR